MREMKDSGIEWEKQVPANWTNDTIRNLLIARDGGAWGNEPSEDDEGVICLRIADFDFDKGKFADKPIEDLTRRSYKSTQIQKLLLQKNDICIEKSGGGEKTPVGRAVLFDKDYPALFANFMERLRFDTTKVYPTFVEYWLRTWYASKGSPYYINQTTGIQNINLSLMIAKERLFFPSVDEQHRISAYLDSKCAEIDALTVDIQSQIDTLEQYKRSVITEAVTKGLDKDVEMKDSGSQYWGEIPATWDIVDIKYLFEIVKRIAGREGYDILSITQHGIKVRDTSTNEGQVAADYSNYQFLYPGEFAMNHMDLLTGWVDLSDKFGVTSPDYRVFRLRDTKRNSRRYYKYIMQICYMCRIFYSLGNGVSNLGRWRLQTSFFNNFKVPVPSYEEQKAIADYLDAHIGGIEEAIELKNEQLSTLDNFKKSLIFEYVTGKKEAPAV